jgi:hypothetical protein
MNAATHPPRELRRAHRRRLARRAAAAAWALWLAACAHAPDATSARREAARAPEEALDLLAEWVALAGLGDPSAMRRLETRDFVFRERSAAGAERHEERAGRLRLCGDAELRVVDGGVDVAMWVQTLGDDGVVRCGPRRLSMRWDRGALRVASDAFEVLRERELPSTTSWLAGFDCGGGAPMRDEVVFVDPDPRRRIVYPAPWRPTGSATPPPDVAS